MSVFATRPPGYKVGLAGVFVATGLYIAGYGAPYWVVSPVNDQNVGLWMACSEHYGCFNMGVSGYAPFFHVVRFAETIGLMALVMACGYGMLVNCYRTVPSPFSRTLESLSFSGGIFGLIGTIVFFSKSEAVISMYSWVICLSTVSSVVAIACFILISVNNKAPSSSSPPPVVGSGQPLGGRLVSGTVEMSGVVVQSGSQSATPYPSAPPAYYYGPSSSAPDGIYHVPSPQQPPQSGYPSQYPAPSYYPSSSFPSK